MPTKKKSSKTVKVDAIVEGSVEDNKILLNTIHTGYAVIALSLLSQSIYPAIIGLVLMFIISKFNCEKWQLEHIKWIERTNWVGIIVAIPILTLGSLVDVGYFWLFLGIFTIPLYIWIGMRLIKGWLILFRNQKTMKLNSWFW